MSTRTRTSPLPFADLRADDLIHWAAETDAHLIEYDGKIYRVEVERDDDAGDPTTYSDGHGPITDYLDIDDGDTQYGREYRLHNVTRQGEARYYDVANAQTIALRDGWGPDPTKAVQDDFEFLQGWFSDDWEYGIITVTRQIGSVIESSSSGGVELRNTAGPDARGYLIEEILKGQIDEVDALLADQGIAPCPNCTGQGHVTTKCATALDQIHEALTTHMQIDADGHASGQMNKAITATITILKEAGYTL